MHSQGKQQRKIESGKKRAIAFAICVPWLFHFISLTFTLKCSLQTGFPSELSEAWGDGKGTRACVHLFDAANL